MWPWRRRVLLVSIPELSDQSVVWSNSKFGRGVGRERVCATDEIVYLPAGAGAYIIASLINTRFVGIP